MTMFRSVRFCASAGGTWRYCVHGFLLLAAAAAAQDLPGGSTDERMLACAGIRDADERVACFDRVVEEMAGTQTPVPPPPAPPPPGPAPATVESLPPEPAAASAAQAPELAAAPSASAAPAAVAPEAVADPAPAADAAGNFGLEREIARREREASREASEDIRIEASIVKAERSGINHFVVLLDNGQVWEETDGSRRGTLPKAGLPVSIYEGRLGGYRMKIGNDNRIAWVRRLK